MSNRVLLIYPELPERTRLFLLDLDDAELERVKNCHQLYVNSDVLTPDLEWVTDQVCGRWEAFEITESKSPVVFGEEDTPLTVVVSGFLL